MAILTLAKAKEYLRVDDTDFDNDVTRAMSTAEAYMSSYTAKTFDSTNTLAVECCLMLTSQFYENRGGVTEGKYKAMDIGITNLLLILKHTPEAAT